MVRKRRLGAVDTILSGPVVIRIEGGADAWAGKVRAQLDQELGLERKFEGCDELLDAVGAAGYQVGLSIEKAIRSASMLSGRPEFDLGYQVGIDAIKSA